MSGRAIDSSVTLDEVFAVVSAKRVPLAPELAGYLALEISEHADPSGGDVDPKGVLIGEEGTVALIQPKRQGAHGDAEASIRAALGRLLEAGGSQTPSLLATSRRKSGFGLPGLAEELEAALIPVNRAAGRRALARLAREVRRVTLGVGRNSPLWGGNNGIPSSSRRAAPPLPAVETELEHTATTTQFVPGAAPSSQKDDVDALIATFAVSAGEEHRHTRALKAMADVEPTPSPPSDQARPTGLDSGDSGLESLLASGAHSPTPALLAPNDEALRRQLPTRPSFASTRMTGGASRWRGAAVALVVATAAIAAGAYGVWQLRPRVERGRAAEPSSPGPADVAPASASALRGPAGTPPGMCRGTLIISNVPPHAEVLLRGGQAPVDIERMPVGARLELVATAEGFAPRRLVIPAGSSWDLGVDGKPRFETAVQLDKSKAHPGTNDPWPPGEAGSEVGGSGPAGTLHVVASPHGAEIWIVEGAGPEARVEGASCNDGVDVLLAGPTTYRKRLHVSANDFVPDEGSGPSKAGGTAAPKRPALLVARVDAR
jgi:hypothetical protein